VEEVVGLSPGIVILRCAISNPCAIFVHRLAHNLSQDLVLGAKQNL
jgi:hypothetical protein